MILAACAIYLMWYPYKALYDLLWFLGVVCLLNEFNIKQTDTFFLQNVAKIA